MTQLTVQSAVANLVKLGSLPSETLGDAPSIARFQKAMELVSTPISDQDARALVKLFGSDDCFGLAWTLVHLIETAPGWPLPECFARPDNEWIIRLSQRAGR